MFGKLFIGELRKILRPKTILVLCILFIVFFVLFAVIYNINWEATMQSAIDQVGDENISGYMDILNSNIIDFKAVTSENVDNYIMIYQQELDASIESENGLDYCYRCIVTLLNYIKTNNLYGQDLNIAGYSSSLSSSAENFASAYFSIVLTILIIYAVVSMAGIYVDEYKNGTIKLVMMRPITRNQLTLAKILSMFTVLIGFLGITTLIGYFYGLAAFESTSADKIIVLFNARTVSVMNNGGYIFIKMIFGAISLMTYGLISFTLGTVLRKKTPAILISLVIMLEIISGLLSFIGIDRFLLTPNIDLSVYFGFSFNIASKSNFFIGMPMLIVYSAIMYAATFYVTNKRDIV